MLLNSLYSLPLRGREISKHHCGVETKSYAHSTTRKGKTMLQQNCFCTDQHICEVCVEEFYAGSQNPDCNAHDISTVDAEKMLLEMKLAEYDLAVAELERCLQNAKVALFKLEMALAEPCPF